MLNLPISRDAFLWALSIVSQVNRVPLSTNLILKKFPPPYTLASLRLATEYSGVKVRQKAVPASQLEKLPSPCLVALIPASAQVPSGAQRIQEYQLGLLERVDAATAVFAEACSSVSLPVSRSAFEQRFAGEVLIIAPQLDHPATHENSAAQVMPSDDDSGLTWLRRLIRAGR